MATDYERIISEAIEDCGTIQEAVNEVKIVSPRYGDDFKSLPMIAEEFQDAIETAAAAGAGANGWTDLLIQTEDGSTQRAKNASFQAQIDSKANTTYVDAQDSLKADKSYVDAIDASLQSQINQKATAAYLDAALDEQTQTVNTALSQLSTQASKFYPTLAEANADIANITVNQPVQVGEADNGGLWYKATAEAESLTKSDYDPLTQANTYTFEYVRSLIEHSPSNETDIVNIKDKNGKTVYKATRDGKHYLVGIDTDLATALNTDANSYIDGGSTDIISVKDINGKDVLKQTASGDLILPSIGNLTKALAAKLETDALEGIDVVEAKHSASQYADNTLMHSVNKFYKGKRLLTKDEVKSLNLFTHDVGLLRIPAITRVDKYKYVLFFEARETWEDTANISIGNALITIDPETKDATVSDIVKLHESFTDGQSKLRTFMNPCGVKLDNGDLIVMYVRRHELLEHELYMRKSLDNGKTWSEYVDISNIYKGTGTPNWNLLCACSQGMVKRYGDNKGRVIFPAWTTGAAYNQADFRSGFIYSDDNGENWQLGKFTDYSSSNECQVAEDINGDLLLCVRREDRSPAKLVARFDGESYKELPTNTEFTNEIIMSGFIQAANKYDFSNPKFIMTTCKTTDRTGMLIHTSYDGEDWATLDVSEVSGNKIAYTCVESIDADLKFVLWESNYTKDFDCAVISTKNLLNKGA